MVINGSPKFQLGNILITADVASLIRPKKGININSLLCSHASQTPKTLINSEEYEANINAIRTKCDYIKTTFVYRRWNVVIVTSEVGGYTIVTLRPLTERIRKKTTEKRKKNKRGLGNLYFYPEGHEEAGKLVTDTDLIDKHKNELIHIVGTSKKLLSLALTFAKSGSILYCKIGKEIRKHLVKNKLVSRGMITYKEALYE